MKTILLTLTSIFILLTDSKSQSTSGFQNSKDLELINLIFDKIEIQGVDTKQNLLYGYFFLDKDNSKLEELKNELIGQKYHFVKLDKQNNSSDFILHVEKVQQQTRESLLNQKINLRILAEKYNVTFDGFDVGNADPTKPLITSESFYRFMNTKKGNHLFNLGIKLYEMEINDKAELVFKECIAQKIKPDTSSYKLGNILIAQNKVEEGINYLLQAINSNPSYLHAFYNLGATYYDLGQYHKSIQYYQEADKLKPNDDRILYGIASSQYVLQQYDKSLENCLKALQSNKDNQNARQLMQMLKGKTRQ